MAYYLGIDLGTTYTAAAAERGGVVEALTLGNRTASVPSVVFLRDDGEILVGEAATRRATSDPGRVAREFKRRLGDPTPIILGGTPYGAEMLMARLLRWSVDRVREQQGEAPQAIALTHPANWGPYKLDLLRQAVRQVDVDASLYLAEPVAAATFYASQRRLEPGSVVAVYDLGGGTFDAAMVRRQAVGFEIIGSPEGIERLGGIDFDEAVFAHVRDAVGEVVDRLDPEEATAQAAVARLRQECIDAKEALSSDTDVSIPVLLPGLQTEVRLTRSEFEAMIRPAISETIVALRRAIRSADVTADDISAVLLVGGSSRIPLVAQMVGAELGRPIAIDAHPKDAIAYGAAIAAAAHGGSATPETVTTVLPDDTRPPPPTMAAGGSRRTGDTRPAPPGTAAAGVAAAGLRPPPPGGGRPSPPGGGQPGAPARPAPPGQPVPAAAAPGAGAAGPAGPAGRPAPPGQQPPTGRQPAGAYGATPGQQSPPGQEPPTGRQPAGAYGATPGQQSPPAGGQPSGAATTPSGGAAAARPAPPATGPGRPTGAAGPAPAGGPAARPGPPTGASPVGTNPVDAGPAGRRPPNAPPSGGPGRPSAPPDTGSARARPLAAPPPGGPGRPATPYGGTPRTGTGVPSGERPVPPIGRPATPYGATPRAGTGVPSGGYPAAPGTRVTTGGDKRTLWIAVGAIAAVALVVILVLFQMGGGDGGGTGGGTGDTSTTSSAGGYTDAVETAFLGECQASSAGDGVCQCAYDQFEATVPFDRFVEIDQQLNDDPDARPQELVDILDSCLTTATTAAPS